MAKRRALMLVLFLLLCLSVTSAFATQLFIATTGNDTTGDGSIGNPFATLRRTFDWTQTDPRATRRHGQLPRRHLHYRLLHQR